MDTINDEKSEAVLTNDDMGSSPMPEPGDDNVFQEPTSEEPEVYNNDSDNESVNRQLHVIAQNVEKSNQLLVDSFKTLTTLFEEKLTYDTFKENLVTKLHGELQGYRQDVVAKLTQPWLLGYVRLHDGIGKALEACRKKQSSDLTSDYYMNLIQGFQEDIEIILRQFGVDTFHEEEDTFNIRTQTISDKEATDEPDREGMISRRIRPGFIQEEKILRKEMVAVYVKGKDGEIGKRPEPSEEKINCEPEQNS